MIEIFATQMNYRPEPDTIAFLLRCQVYMNDRIVGESYLNYANSIKYMFQFLSCNGLERRCNLRLAA
mgnify:CR=1 FL=1